jgi:hypothetical protein
MPVNWPKALGGAARAYEESEVMDLAAQEVEKQRLGVCHHEAAHTVFATSQRNLSSVTKMAKPARQYRAWTVVGREDALTSGARKVCC